MTYMDLKTLRPILGGCNTLGDLFERIDPLPHTSSRGTNIYSLDDCFLEVLTSDSADTTLQTLAVCQKFEISCAPRAIASLSIGDTGSTVVAYQYESRSRASESQILHPIPDGLKGLTTEQLESMTARLKQDVTILAAQGIIHEHAALSTAHWRILQDGEHPRFILQNWYSARTGSSREQKEFIQSMQKLIDSVTQSHLKMTT